MSEVRPIRKVEELIQPIENNVSDEDVMSKAEQELIDFVSKQLKKMDNKLLFEGNSSPTIMELDLALVQHPHIFLALTSLYQQSRWDLQVAQEKYDDFIAQKFNEIREEVNTRDITASKWCSKEELNYILRSRFTKEIRELKAEVMIAENKRSFLQRLLDGWNTYGFTLNQLSKNSIAELSSNKMAKYDGESDE